MLPGQIVSWGGGGGGVEGGGGDGVRNLIPPTGLGSGSDGSRQGIVKTSLWNVRRPESATITGIPVNV